MEEPRDSSLLYKVIVVQCNKRLERRFCQSAMFQVKIVGILIQLLYPSSFMKHVPSTMLPLWKNLVLLNRATLYNNNTNSNLKKRRKNYSFTNS